MGNVLPVSPFTVTKSSSQTPNRKVEEIRSKDEVTGGPLETLFSPPTSLKNYSSTADLLPNTNRILRRSSKPRQDLDIFYDQVSQFNIINDVELTSRDNLPCPATSL